MNRAIAILGGIGAGVAAVYFLDPKKGADRRALVRDKFNTLKEDASQKVSEMTEGLKDQASGMVRDAKGMIGDGKETSGLSQQQQAGKSSGFNTTTSGHSTAM